MRPEHLNRNRKATGPLIQGQIHSLVILFKIMTPQQCKTWLATNFPSNSPAIEVLNLIEGITKAIESIEDAAYSVQDWSGTHLGETLDEARKTAGLPFYG
jgi:hypothetical protein